MTSFLNRVLHVDDDMDIRDIAGIALREIGGLDLVQCESGYEALDAAPSFAPDLVVLDMMMPQLDGAETLERLRKLPGLENVAVIFMTAKGNQMSHKRLLELGALGVIMKPFDPMTLADDIHCLWQDHKVA